MMIAPAFLSFHYPGRCEETDRFWSLTTLSFQCVFFARRPGDDDYETETNDSCVNIPYIPKDQQIQEKNKRKTSLESFFKDFSSWLTEPGYKWDIRAPTKSKRYILWENYQNTLSTNTRKGSGWTVDLKNGSFTLHLLVEWEWDDILNGWDGPQPQWRTFSQGPPTRFLVCLYWIRTFTWYVFIESQGMTEVIRNAQEWKRYHKNLPRQV